MAEASVRKIDSETIIEITEIKTILERILDHHNEFKSKFDKMDSKVSEMIDSIHDEKTERLESIQSIKDELHGRINTIMFSILGGAGLFVMGIVMWLIEGRKP